eukprot:559476-Amorphochlora_amoeboformis.AAC.1
MGQSSSYILTEYSRITRTLEYLESRGKFQGMTWRDVTPYLKSETRNPLLMRSAGFYRVQPDGTSSDLRGLQRSPAYL